MQTSGNKSVLDKDSGFLRTNIPVSDNLSKVLGSLPTLSPEYEKYAAENKSASDIRKGGVKHSRGFSLFASSDPTIKLFEESFTNTVSEIFRSKLFIDDSFSLSMKVSRPLLLIIISISGIKSLIYTR